jgi:hypothetical protein
MISQVVLDDGRRIVKFACDTDYCESVTYEQYGPKETPYNPHEWGFSAYDEKSEEFCLTLCPECIRQRDVREFESLEKIYDEQNIINQKKLTVDEESVGMITFSTSPKKFPESEEKSSAENLQSLSSLLEFSTNPNQPVPGPIAVVSLHLSPRDLGVTIVVDNLPIEVGNIKVSFIGSHPVTCEDDYDFWIQFPFPMELAGQGETVTDGMMMDIAPRILFSQGFAGTWHVNRVPMIDMNVRYSFKQV